MAKLYAADGIKDDVEFQMHAAIRTAGDPSSDHQYECPDEDVGCPMTLYVLCAMDGASVSEKVTFLTCWDESSGTISSRAKKCVAKTSIKWSAVEACATGSDGKALQLAATEYFEKTFPSHAHAGHFQVPHIFVDGKDQLQNTGYDSLLKALCATGITAGACSSSANATSTVAVLV